MPVEDHVAWTVGRYTVHGELASGGMATVHIGRMGAAGGFAKLVAIKRMHPQFAKDPDFLAMFLDEARLVTRIRHPNVVQPLDVIVERGEVLLVMEYIHGDALSRLNRVLRARSERIPLRIAIAIMSGVLHGLHAAHEAKSEKGEPLGIVHRDVSPQNVIVGVDGVARVLDFGIAKAADQVHLTREGELKGKLVYMAPEQLLGETLTRRTDIFSAAVVLWECLTGQRLFESDSQSALLARARMQKVDPPSHLAPEIPPALDEIVLKGLAMRQNERWATARDMALALEETVPPATTAQVGGWVEEVASRALAERQSRIHEIESAGAESVASTRELVADITSDRVFTQDILSARSISGSRPSLTGPRPSSPGDVPPPPPAARSGSHLAPARLTPTPPSIRSNRDVPPPPPPNADNSTRFDRPQQRASSPGLSPIAPNAPTVHDPFYVPPVGPIAPAAASGPIAPLSLEAPAIPTELAKPAKTHVVKLRSGRWGTVAILALLLVFLGFVLLAPMFVRKGIVDSLAQRGLVATIDEVDLYSQIGTARVVGLTLASPEVPGATVRAREVLVGLTGNLDAKSFVARDVDVNVDVGYAALLKSLTAWSQKHGNGSPFAFPPTMERARVESAHVIWNQPSGAGTRLEATSLTLDMTPAEGRKLGQDFKLDPTSVDVATPLGRVGPWLVEASRVGATTTVHVSFSQAHQQSFGLDFTGGDATSKLDLRAERATPSDIGLKPDLFGAGPGDAVKIDWTGHAERKDATWTATTDLVVDGLKLPNAPAAQLEASFAVTGHEGAPLGGRGRFSLGVGESPLEGTVTILPDGVVAKLSWTLVARCNQAGVRAPITLSLDTRDLGAAVFTPQGPFCTAAIKK